MNPTETIDEREIPTQHPEGALLSSFLRAAREHSSYTLQDAAHDADIVIDRLARIEIGAASPDADELSRLCDIYGCDIDAVSNADGFLPQLPSRAVVENDMLVLGPIAIPLDMCVGNDSVLAAVGSAVRTLRHLADDAPIHLRKSELATIGAALDLDNEHLATDVANALRLSAVESYELVELLRSDTSMHFAR